MDHEACAPAEAELVVGAIGIDVIDQNMFPYRLLCAVSSVMRTYAELGTYLNQLTQVLHFTSTPPDFLQSQTMWGMNLTSAVLA